MKEFYVDILKTAIAEDYGVQHFNVHNINNMFSFRKSPTEAFSNNSYYNNNQSSVLI